MAIDHALNASMSFIWLSVNSLIGSITSNLVPSSSTVLALSICLSRRSFKAFAFGFHLSIILVWCSKVHCHFSLVFSLNPLSMPFLYLLVSALYCCELSLYLSQIVVQRIYLFLSVYLIFLVCFLLVLNMQIISRC